MKTVRAVAGDPLNGSRESMHKKIRREDHADDVIGRSRSYGCRRRWPFIVSRCGLNTAYTPKANGGDESDKYVVQSELTLAPPSRRVRSLPCRRVPDAAIVML